MGGLRYLLRAGDTAENLSLAKRVLHGRSYRRGLRVTALATVGAGTITTELLASSDIIVRDPTGADRTDTLDTVANVVAGLLTADGDSCEILYRNVNGSAEAITLAFPSGYTLHFAPGATLYILDGGAVRIRLTRLSSTSIAVEVTRAGAHPAPTVDSTAGALAMTLKMIASGLIERDPNGAARADTVPTQASLIATLLPYDGATWDCVVKNTGAATEDITVTTDGTTTVQGAVVDVADGRSGILRFCRLTDNSVTCLVLGDAT